MKVTKGKVIKKYQEMNPGKQKGLNLHKMKKDELIRLIQITEGNNACFKSDQSGGCSRTECMWFKECTN